jgi:hypothetical protein
MIFVEVRFIRLNHRHPHFSHLPGLCRSADGTARSCIQNQLAAVNDKLSVDQQ